MLLARMRNCHRASHYWLNRVRSGAFAFLYGPAARYYDWFTSWLFLGEWARWQATVLALLPPSGRVVELGSGTGQLAALGSHHHRQWIAIEPSGAMIAVARRKHQPHGSVLIQGMAQWIPLRSATADAIVAVFPGPYILDPETAAEIRRVVKPNGIVIVAIGGELAGHGIRRRLRQLALRLFYGPRSPEIGAAFDLPGVSGVCTRMTTHYGAVSVYLGTITSTDTNDEG